MSSMCGLCNTNVDSKDGKFTYILICMQCLQKVEKNDNE